MENFEVSIEENLSANEFISKYLNSNKPVLIKGALASTSAYKKWSLDYFFERIPDMKFIAKHLDVMDENTSAKFEEWSMGDYVRTLQEYARLTDEQKLNASKPPYCHDIPIFKLKPELIEDIESFPIEYLPEFYQKNWWDYAQFFMSPQGAVSPLHFDSLCTHNLFFQVKGVKVFTLFHQSDWENCYRYNWKWFKVDPENPDTELYPKFKNANPIKVTVNPGDILLMPKGTLHHVRSLQESFSFNIDFHTKESVTQAITSLPKDQPKNVFYYNSLIALGLNMNISPDIIYPRYEEYLYYLGE